jgi:hypothetical protein
VSSSVDVGPAVPSEPENPREAIIAAGRRRLLQHAVDALRSQLNASMLSGESSIARDTAYRAFRRDSSGEKVSDAIIAAVVQAAEEWDQEGYRAALEDAIDAYHASVVADDDVASNLKAALRAAFTAQFRSPGVPTGWVIQAAALTASEAWEGDPPAPEDVAIAQVILDIRRHTYQAITDQLVGLAHVAMSDLGRRPAAGADLRAVVTLTHALLDGAVLRRFLEPDAMPGELFAEGLYRLWVAFSEPGSYDDPRRPHDEDGRRLFDAVLAEAAELWRTQEEVSVEEVAEQALVPVDAALQLFPTVGDLADSLVRTRVVAGGFPRLGPAPDRTAARQQLVVLVGQLQRLRDLADAVPHAVAASWAHRPTVSRPFVEELVDNEVSAIQALDLADHPRDLVDDLVRFAARGTPGWDTVLALLRTVGYRSDRVL